MVKYPHPTVALSYKNKRITDKNEAPISPSYCSAWKASFTANSSQVLYIHSSDPNEISPWFAFTEPPMPLQNKFRRCEWTREFQLKRNNNFYNQTHLLFFHVSPRGDSKNEELNLNLSNAEHQIHKKRV